MLRGISILQSTIKNPLNLGHCHVNVTLMKFNYLLKKILIESKRNNYLYFFPRTAQYIYMYVII